MCLITRFPYTFPYTQSLVQRPYIVLYSVCVPCCCLGSALRLKSIVRCSSCSERIFCWFGINSFHCQSRTSQPSVSLPSCNFFASPLELEPFHLMSAAAVLPCLYTTRTMIIFLSLVRHMRLLTGGRGLDVSKLCA